MEEILNLLRATDAPRVWTTRMLVRALNMPDASAARRIARAADMGLLSIVRNGLFLNTLCYPRPVLAEATPFVRSGGVVSLQTVLGDAAVLNNWTPDVTAILPTNGMNSAGGQVKTAGGMFTFRRMPDHMLYAGDMEDRLVAGLTYLRATPEKALLDWIALAKSSYSTMSDVPAHDIDLSELNKDRLMRLARASGLEDEVDKLEERASRAEDSMSYGLYI